MLHCYIQPKLTRKHTHTHTHARTHTHTHTHTRTHTHTHTHTHARTHTHTQCSSTCRGGIRERQVDCYQNFTDFSSDTNFTFGIVNDTVCDQRTMPARVLECNRLIPCPFRWDVSEWQEVSVLCV